MTVWLAALLLSGCGTSQEDGQVAAADAAATPAAKAEESPAFDIRVELAGEQTDKQTKERLRELIERHNSLQRYRAVDDLDDSEWERLLALTEKDVRQLLATEGYFSAKVTLRREPAAANKEGARPVVVIAADPGTATRVNKVNIGFDGDLATAGDTGAQELRRSIIEGWGLPEGQFFTQDRWADAKTGALRQLVERRYPLGQVSRSTAEVDPQQSAAALDVRLDSGPPFRLGPAVVRGAERYPDWLPQRLSWLKPGDEYNQKKLVEAQQRLAGSGYYDSAYISIDPQGDPNAVPVTFAVTEAKRHKLQLGLGYSTDGGPRVSVEHRDNTIFGTSWRMDTKLNLDIKAPLLQAEWSSLPGASGWRKAAFARHMRQDDGSLVTTSQTFRVGLMKNAEVHDRNLYLQYDNASVTGSASVSAPSALVGDGAALSANVSWTGRYFDAMPTPTRGFGLQGEAGVGMTLMGQRKPFVRLNGRWLGLLPLAKGKSTLALRSELGAVFASDSARLPSTYMFRTGGDTTVRGYAWRSIGIPLGGDWVGPGRYLAVGSVEWRRPILQKKLPGLLEHTLFVDVGGVANRIGDLRLKTGIGTGVRVLSPVGPMELSVAYGLQSKDFRVHMTVGMVF
ncbi:MAG: BamA/TamA family outer membrane protein [Burkholderiaceae bacterium]|jgi:translocation and assembly module TamA|nr:BamA/TamA family outer membrane protein [Burkholderiaceae bacterium]